MTNRLTNKQASMFNDILKTYNNAFFKDLPNKEILEELEDIIIPNNLMDIAASSPTYTTKHLNKFIRNIINFDIKTFDNLKNKDLDTNMEFVGKTPGASTYAYNNKIKEVIIDKLNIINVFVDLLDAYKYCIDNENNSSIKSGYSENVNIESIQIVANTTRLYTEGGSAAIYPTVSAEPNAGYIKKVKNQAGDNDATDAKITLFLSIQSFNAGFSDLTLYDKLFEKTGSAGTVVSAGTAETLTTTNFLSGSGATHPSTTDTNTVHYLTTNTYYRQTFLLTDKNTPITSSGTRDEVNVKTIKMFLKCLISIEPSIRKQTVYALYYYYNFLQLYSTLIINICNVMFADVRDTVNNPLCIETINTTYNQRNSRSVSGVKIKNAGAGYTAGEIISFTDSAAATDKIEAAFNKLIGITAIPLTEDKLNNIITNRGLGYTTSNDINADVKKMNNASPPVEVTGTVPTTRAVITTIIVPVAMANTTTTQDENINKLERVYNNVIASITSLQKEIIKYGTNNNLKEKDIDIVVYSSTTGADGLEVTKSPKKNVIISLKRSTTIETLEKLDRENDIVNNYYVYDNIRKYSYNILEYNNKTTTIELTLDAFFNYEDAYPNGDTSKGTFDIFKDSNNKEFTDAEITAATARLTPPSSGNFLSINRKDLNSYRIDYNTNKQSLAELNETIDMNERIYNNQRNLYDVQFNKNTFLNRQVLIFNIIICILVLILIIINVVNIDKEHIKSISLACLGIILLLLVIYYISNITYIETFQTQTTEFTKLKRNYAITNAPTFASNKYKILDNLITDVNSKFSSYFEKIFIVLPSVDTTTMYREIKDTTQSESDKKKHIKALLLAKKDQSLNNMNALKYELDNNKLYILTLLISSIIFIGLYNIYINYITEDKYVSLIIFISFIIFIVILSYYIINSNRRVRSSYKNIYWGPELSTDF